MSKTKIKVAVVGATGYTGAELLRLLIHHPEVELVEAYSRSKAGLRLDSLFPELTGLTNLSFTDQLSDQADCWFLGLPHGATEDFLGQHQFMLSRIQIVDLSNAFRHKNSNRWENRNFVFGLPELNAKEIIEANSIANPGCFATAITLGLAPLYRENRLGEEDLVHVNATTGSTGAGVGLSETSHFSYRQNNLSWYKAFTHQHMQEISEQLTQKADAKTGIFFLPQRGAFARGIFATSYFNYTGSLDEAYTLYRDFYKEAPFTQVVSGEISMKQVIGTNYCHIHLHKHANTLLVTSAIDNLMKGASGQAIQNFNLMNGLDQSTGLQLKSIAY